MDVTEISKADLKKIHDILDRVYELNPDDKENVLRFMRFLSKRDYLHRRDYNRNGNFFGIKNDVVDDKLCSIQINELQSIAYGQESIVNLVYTLLFKHKNVVFEKLLSDFFRRFCCFLDIIESEKMVDNQYLYDEMLLINSYMFLKTLQIFGDIEEHTYQNGGFAFEKEIKTFIKEFPIIDGVDKIDVFLDLKKSIDTLTELIRFDNNRFDINKFIFAYMRDINGYSSPNMLGIIECMGKFVSDEHSLLIDDSDYDIINIATALSQAFINKSDKMIYYSKALLKGDRFQYINSKLEEIEDNPNIRNEIFGAIANIDISLFDYLNNSEKKYGEDSFIGLMDIVFDSDSYYELFSKLEALNKIGECVHMRDYVSVHEVLDGLKTDLHKEKIDEYIVKYSTNTMNKIEKPKTIVARMKFLYRNVYPQIHLVGFDKIHLGSNSYNNFVQTLLYELSHVEDKTATSENDSKEKSSKYKNRRFGW